MSAPRLLLPTPPPDSPSDALARRVAHLQSLHRVGVALAGTKRPAEIGQVVMDEMMQLAGAGRATFYQLDTAAQALVPRLSRGWDDRCPVALGLSRTDDLAVDVARTGRAARWARPGCGDHAGMGTDADAGEAGTEPADVRGRLAMPLVARDEVLGVVDLHLSQCAALAPDLEEMLATLASQAALVLRNARDNEELEQHYREISLLYEVQQEISGTFDYQGVLALIVDRTKRLLGAAECTIRLLDDHPARGPVMRVAATTGRIFVGPDELPLSEALVDRQVLGGEMLVMDDVRTDPRFADNHDAVAAGAVTLLCAPLVARARIIGTIRLYTAERREFSQSDRKMLAAIAGQAATAIDHARLYRAVEDKNRQLSESYDTLRAAQKELVRKEKLAALGEMAATVAHEIRNPLTSVRGFAQRIGRKYAEAGDGRLGEYTGIIISEVDRLNKFIKDVLDFARRAKPSFERTDLNGLLEDVVRLVHPEFAAQGIVIVPDLAPDLKTTVADGPLLTRALMNVLHNSRQAMPRGGVLSVQTRNHGPGAVRMRFVDNGGGIAREILQKIWTPFYTTKVSGTGLGLALVLRIVDDHRGRVSVRSRMGKGTIVTITLPVTEHEDELLAPRPTEEIAVDFPAPEEAGSDIATEPPAA